MIIDEKTYAKMPPSLQSLFDKQPNPGSDEVLELFPDAGGGKASGYNFQKSNNDNSVHNATNIKSGVHFGDSGSAARFFYTAKTSKSERNAGLNDSYEQQFEEGQCGVGALRDSGRGKTAYNPHPTVKPVDLMRYLVRLVTPKNGHVLDPFMGSGSTGIACGKEAFQFTGIELDDEMVKIAEKRMERHFTGFSWQNR